MCTRGLYTQVLYINTGNGQNSHRDICSMSINLKKNTNYVLRVHLHQASASTLRPLCVEASDSVLIEINGDI